ncbi:MAG: peptidoglycan DD-metalloendopeptidase family protein [bacterium]|nr:LysM peptidoglycan-binding domain-containing protein [Gammaproteobacteria bacterium]HIL97984.1 LysM peptidoglycan-binding domain-containing protein [Pseudomonadales bacterium]
MLIERFTIGIGLLCVILALISGCRSGSNAPVSSIGEQNRSSSGYHVVSKGETLYSISFVYGIDYREIAAANKIQFPYTIFVNQRLRIEDVRPPTSTKVVVKQPSKKAPASGATEQGNRNQRSNVEWQWPLRGEVISQFSLSGEVNKGIDIRGKLGGSVNSAADGVVVYAGGGLRGYGKLVIVKHNDHFLSAYGNNREILVKEGDQVKSGQAVAEVGSSGKNVEMLHFQIRRDGKPEDPLIYLPKEPFVTL